MSAFFLGWQLWQQMTFVLTVAILVTFAVGFIKLWYITRYERKHEVIDEEKRLKVEEMRRSGIQVKSKTLPDIPFGVRALEKGIQVNGIYVETHSLKASVDSVRSSGSFVSSTQSSVISTLDSMGRIASERNSLSMPVFPNQLRDYSVSGGRATPTAEPVLNGHHSSYKPRRSSQLRFSSYGETAYDGDTLDRLEGRSRGSAPRAHRPRGHPVEDVTYSSSDLGADNERSSGASEDSDGTLADHDYSLPMSPMLRPSGFITSAVANYRAAGTANYSPIPAHANHSPTTARPAKDYAWLPAVSPEEASFDPFAIPRLASPAVNDPLLMSQDDFSRVARVPSLEYEELDITTEAQNSLLNTARSNSPEPSFGAGTLHVNKFVRKSNSGFEILPAGTFGAINELGANQQGPEPDMSRHSTFGLKRSTKRLSKYRPSSLVEKTRSRSLSLTGHLQ